MSDDPSIWILAQARNDALREARAELAEAVRLLRWVSDDDPGWTDAWPEIDAFLAEHEDVR